MGTPYDQTGPYDHPGGYDSAGTPPQQPIVTFVQTPAEPRQYVLVTGAYFGEVAAAFLQNGSIKIPVASLQVDAGNSAHITIPPDIPVDSVTGTDYTVVLETIQGLSSVNNAGFLHIVQGTAVIPPPTPTVVDETNELALPAPGTFLALDLIRARLRLELGDRLSNFQASIDGTGNLLTQFELPVRHIDATTLSVRLFDGRNNTSSQLVADEGYTLDAFQGSITTAQPLVPGQTIVVSGTRARFFEQDVLDEFLRTAFIQLTYGRTSKTVGLSASGLRQYAEYGFDWDTLPEIEHLPLTIMAKITALWVLATDSSYDIDISADGANIPRTERYRQMMSHITAETLRLQEITKHLNIGLQRIEIQTLRRISRTTGRLVPVYEEREYDDHRLPMRVLPQIDEGKDEGQDFVDPYSGYGQGYGGGFGS